MKKFRIERILEGSASTKYCFNKLLFLQYSICVLVHTLKVSYRCFMWECALPFCSCGSQMFCSLEPLMLLF